MSQVVDFSRVPSSLGWSPWRMCVAWLTCVLALGCGNPVDESGKPADPGASATSAQPAPSEPVVPPFEVRGELDGLLLVWFDAQGVHTAQKRSEIPETSRALVRVDSLRVAPEQRLDPEQVYVADVRTAKADGTYVVRTATRAYFDAKVDERKPPPKVEAVDPASAGVVIYKASWCGACKSAAAFLRSQQVSFVEKDVEKDAAAQAEMVKKAQAKGLTPRGVPVIDFHGEIMLGFDQARLQSLIERAPKAI